MRNKITVYFLLAAASSQKRVGEGISILNLTNAAAGLISAITVLALTFLVKYADNVFLNNYYSYDSGQMLELLFLIMMLLLYVLAIFGPPVYVGAKNGARAGVSVLIAEFLWFVIFLLLFVLLFQSGLTSGIFPRPYPDEYRRF